MKREIRTKTEEIKKKKNIRSYFKNSTKWENLNEMSNFLDRYQLLKFNQDHVNFITSSIMAMEIETVIEQLPMGVRRF